MRNVIKCLTTMLLLPVVAFASESTATPAAGAVENFQELSSIPENAQGNSGITVDNAEKVGLVLSGGGARGIAEIAVIKVLEENDIPIDYITGTSIGAIVGGLYASGYSPDEMMQLVKSRMFMDAAAGRINPSDSYYFFNPEERPAMVNLNFNRHTGKMAPLFPMSLISPMPMNFSFMSIFAAYTGQCKGNFDNLFVPLRTISSDMTAKHKVVWRSGQLSEAVRSSMSFPIVFKPVEVDGSLLYDGGIYDNFPVDVMRDDFNPDVMIGVDIHSSAKPNGFPDVVQQMDILVMRPCSYELPDSDGIKLRIDLNNFSLLDFAKADEIYRIGYEHATAMVDSIKGRIKARCPYEEVQRRRADFKARTPHVVFDSVNVTGASPAINNYIGYTFKAEPTDTFGLESAMESYAKILSTRQLYDLAPQAVYNPSTGLYKLNLTANVKPDINVGVGGYITSATNSMLYVSGGFRSLSFRSMDASLAGWLGQSYMAADLNLRMILRRKQSTAIGVEAVVWREKFYESDKLFYEHDTPAFITKTEAFGRLSYGVATARHSRFDVGVAVGHQDDKFYNNDSQFNDKDSRNTTKHDIAQAMARWEYNTLNNITMPSSGHYFGAMLQGDIAHYNHDDHAKTETQETPHPESGNERWLQLEARYRGYKEIGSQWSIGLESTLLVSTRHLMECYNAALVNAPTFHPTPSSYNTFNPWLTANSFITAGLVPIFKINDFLSIRGSLHTFIPIREIVKSKDGKAKYESPWLSKVRAFCELEGVVTLPFGNLTVYGNFQTSPGDQWGFGVTFGYFILAPRMLRL